MVSPAIKLAVLSFVAFIIYSRGVVYQAKQGNRAAQSSLKRLALEWVISSTDSEFDHTTKIGNFVVSWSHCMAAAVVLVPGNLFGTRPLLGPIAKIGGWCTLLKTVAAFVTASFIYAPVTFAAITTPSPAQTLSNLWALLTAYAILNGILFTMIMYPSKALASLMIAEHERRFEQERASEAARPPTAKTVSAVARHTAKASRQAASQAREAVSTAQTRIAAIR